MHKEWEFLPKASQEKLPKRIADVHPDELEMPERMGALTEVEEGFLELWRLHSASPAPNSP